MEQANPAAFDRVVRLFKACGDQTIELCEAAITVRTVPLGQESAKAKSSNLNFAGV